MKNVLMILILISFYSCLSHKASIADIKKAKPILLFEKPKDLIHNVPMQLRAGAVIANRSDQHITLKEIIDTISGKKIRSAFLSWAIRYDGIDYFNLRYSSDLHNFKSFAKLDIEGVFCAIIIDKNSPNVLNTNENFYGGGLGEVLIKESSKWNKNWKDKNGNKKRILFIDTRKLRTGYEMARGDYLTRKQLKGLINEYNVKVDTEKIKDISFEKVIEIIKSINKKILKKESK